MPCRLLLFHATGHRLVPIDTPLPCRIIHHSSFIVVHRELGRVCMQTRAQLQTIRELEAQRDALASEKDAAVAERNELKKKMATHEKASTSTACTNS